MIFFKHTLQIKQSGQAWYREEEVKNSEEGEEYSDEDEKEESDFETEEGSEDENIVLVEIGGDESDDNDDEIGETGDKINNDRSLSIFFS